MADPFSSLITTSLSLLSTSSLPSPFPSPTPPSPISQLSLIQTQHQALHDRLQHTLITGTARRKANNRTREYHEGQVEQREERERRLKERVDELRKEVEERKGSETVRNKVTQALNLSYTVVLQTFPSDTHQEEQRSILALLAKRDALSLAILQQRNQLEKLQSERLIARKRMFALNRSNAELATSLKSLTSEVLALESQPPAVQKKYSRHLSDQASLQSRHSIIRSVFLHLVSESGVKWYDPTLPLTEVAPRDDDAEEEEEEEEEMSDKKLLRLMLEAGEGGEVDWEGLVAKEREEVGGREKGKGKGKRGRT